MCDAAFRRKWMAIPAVAIVLLGPMPVAADGRWEPVLEFGGSGAVPDIAVDSKGDVYVFGGPERVVQVFTPLGVFLREWPVREGTYGIAIDENDEVFVLSRCCVRCYTTQGEYLRDWDCRLGMGDLGMGLGLDAKNGMVAVGTVNAIHKFDTGGVFLGQILNWTSWGSVSILPDGSIWALAQAGLVRHYSPDGHILDEWPTTLPGEPRDYPQGLAIDSTGRLFVADGNWLVRIFQPNGVLDDRIEIPRLVSGIELDGDDTLYVGTDFPLGVIKYVYTPVAVEATTWGGIKSHFSGQ